MLDPDYVRGSLERLSKSDTQRAFFGARVHQYRLNPPLPEGTLDAFENRVGAVLPEEYRFFLTHIGNGGAGPYYGLLPLGGYDEGDWEGAGLVGDLSQPFPYEQAWNLPDSFFDEQPELQSDLPEDEQDRLWDAWNAKLEAEYENPSVTRGAIPISHTGCAIRHWLVVNGRCRGEVWCDDRAHSSGIYPLLDDQTVRLTFDNWYLSWLEDALREFGPASPHA